MAWPLPADIDGLGMGGAIVRTVVHDLDGFGAAVAALGGQAQVCALIEGQTEGIGLDPAAWRELVGRFVERFRPDRIPWVELGNEFDLHGVPVETAAALVDAIAPTLADAGFQPILPSVAGPDWPGYLTQLVTRLPSVVRRMCWTATHPYGQRMSGYPRPPWGFGELSDAMALARSLTGLPTVATESGIKIGDANGEPGQAEYVKRWCAWWRAQDPAVYPFGCFFAWSDQVGTMGEQGLSAFGLRRADGTKRPAYDIFARADKGAVRVSDYQYVLGFKAKADELGGAAGEPTEDEHDAEWLGHPVRHQLTTAGDMIYLKELNEVRFMPAGK